MVVNLSKRWLIHLRGGYSRPVPTSVGRTLHVYVIMYVYVHITMYVLEMS